MDRYHDRCTLFALLSPLVSGTARCRPLGMPLGISSFSPSAHASHSICSSLVPALFAELVPAFFADSAATQGLGDSTRSVGESSPV